MQKKLILLQLQDDLQMIVCIPQTQNHPKKMFLLVS